MGAQSADGNSQHSCLKIGSKLADRLDRCLKNAHTAQIPNRMREKISVVNQPIIGAIESRSPEHQQNTYLFSIAYIGSIVRKAIIGARSAKCTCRSSV